jgi:hypothetical protein
MDPVQGPRDVSFWIQLSSLAKASRVFDDIADRLPGGSYDREKTQRMLGMAGCRTRQTSPPCHSMSQIVLKPA